MIICDLQLAPTSTGHEREAIEDDGSTGGVLNGDACACANAAMLALMTRMVRSLRMGFLLSFAEFPIAPAPHRGLRLFTAALWFLFTAGRD